MMSDDEILEVVQAHKEGKKIEYLCGNYHSPEKHWYEVTCSSHWGRFQEFDYRVAPREWWIYVNAGGVAQFTPQDIPHQGYIRVREVIE